MDTQEFIRFFREPKKIKMLSGPWTCDGGILSDTYLHGVPWWFRYQLAEDLIGADFGCDFRGGRCVKERKDWLAITVWREEARHLGLTGKVNFCCDSCVLNAGNLQILPNDPAILEEVAGLFDHMEMGFWRPKVGCILPHKYRSTMCLTGRCHYNKCTSEVLNKIYRLSNIRSEWKRHLKENP